MNPLWESAEMSRPLPPPEDVRVRPTVSLPKKVVVMAERYRALHPEENIQDFSALVARSLIDYAHRKHPELLRDVVMELRQAPIEHEEKQKPRAVRPKKKDEGDGSIRRTGT